MQGFTFHIPTKIIFTMDVSNCIDIHLREMNAAKPFLVTDKNMLNHPQVGRILEILRGNGFEVTIFSKVMPDPSNLIVEEGVKAYKDSNCDSLLAIGGGSSIDTARAVGIVISNGGVIEDYKGRNKFKKRLPSFIAIPTTAGTGSENSHGSVITDNQSKVKMTIFGDIGSPNVAILAPELIINAPPYILATSGMDALTHAVEAVLGKGSSIYSDLLGLQAIEMVFKNIGKFVKETDNIEYAAQMIIASDIAGMACANAGLGLVHSMAHAMGALINRPHGEICALLLPHVMEFNSSLETKDKYLKIADAMGINKDAQAVIDAVKDLNRELGIKTDYKDLKITDEIKEIVVKDSLASAISANNPVSVTREAIYAILNTIF